MTPARAAAIAAPAVQDLLDAMPDAVVALAPGGRLLAMNAAFCDMWNLPARLRVQPVGLRVFWHFLAQMERPAVVARLLEDVMSRPAEAGLRVVAAADGRMLECRHQALRQGGEVTGIVVVMRDVTAAQAAPPTAAQCQDRAAAGADASVAAQARLQNAYAMLSRQSEQLELVLRHMSQGIARITADGRVAFYNERLLELLDLPAALLRRYPTFQEVGDFQRERGDFGADDSYFEPAQRERVFVDLGAVPYYVRRGRGGNLIEVRTVTLPEGGWVRTYADVTEHLNAVTARSRGEALVRSLVDTLPDCVWIKDPQGRYLECNPAFVAASGRSYAELVGQVDGDLFGPEVVGPMRAADRMAIEQGHVAHEVEQPFPGAEPRFWEVRRAAVRDASGATTAILGIARDVTERRRTQILLERSNRLLDVSQAMARVGGWEVDVITGSVFWTAEVYRMLETSPAQYTPQISTTMQFFPPEYVPVARMAIEDAERHGKAHDLEIQMLTATGRRIWVHTVTNVVREGGRTVKRIATLQDITRRKQAEQEQAAAWEAQARMAQQLDMAVSGASLGLWSVHVPSNEVVYSGRWRAILGWDFDEEPRARALRMQLVHPDDRQDTEDAFQQHLAGSPRVFEHELRMRHADSHWVWVRLRGRVVQSDDSGKPLVAAGIAKDITEELIARHAAQREHEMLQAMIEGIETGIMINDGQRLVYMNAGFRRLLGWGPDDDISGLAIDEVIAAEDRPFTLQRRAIVSAGGRVPLGWIKLHTRTGETIQTALSLSRIFLGGKVHYIATASQLSEQDMLDVQIRATQARFERLLVSELEKQQAHIARELHDSLGSELAGMSLMVGGLKSLSPRNARLAEAVARVQEQVQSAAGITRALARGLMPVESHPGAFWDAMEKLAADMSNLRGVPCVLDTTGADTDISMEARNHLYRIAQEAITNALRHGKATRIEIRFSDRGDRRCMEVEADGEPFDARAVAGRELVTGVGLRSIMARAKTIGGSVEFASVPGGGSCVRVFWPRAARGDDFANYM